MLTRVVLLVVAVAAAGMFGLWWSQRSGRFNRSADPEGSFTDPPEPLGERATLVQFSSAFCAPCRATRQLLGQVAGMIEGVTYIEVDAESNLDLVRRLHVNRTPTVLVLSGSGRIVSRAVGLPRKQDVITAIGQTPDTAHPKNGTPSRDSRRSSDTV